MNEIITQPCKECGEPVPQTKGKRPKQYCSISCRSNNWQKRQREINAHIEEFGENHFATAQTAIAAPKVELPPKKQEVPKEAQIAVKSFRPSKEYDTLIRTSNDKAVLETLKAELSLNEMVAADKKKEFNNRIDFKLKRL